MKRMTASLVACVVLFPVLWTPSGPDYLKDFQDYLFWTWLFPTVAATWVISDARQRRRSPPYDFGTLVFLAWPLVVPIYLLKTRGLKAIFSFLVIGGFAALYLLEFYLLMILFPGS